jgi:hypothetical protein
MTVPGFFKESLVLEDYKENTEAPSGSLDQIEKAKTLNMALVYEARIFSILWLRHDQRYVSNTSYSD